MSVAFLRYLPPDPEGDPWGVRLSGGGETVVPAGADYPINPGEHPSGYMFTWESGRTLREFGLVLISAGRGVLETRRAGSIGIKAGDAFFLHPEVWHRYQPDPASGWTENWVNFGGEYAALLMGRFFPPDRPVVRLKHPEIINGLLRDLHRLMRKGVFAANRGVANARFLEILARLHQHSRSHDAATSSAGRIEKACLRLLAHPGSVNWSVLAREAGMSPAHFRRVFRATTGHAPHQYLSRIRINHAKALLRGTAITTENIAEELGFHDAAHFSKAFRSAAGMAPSAYRRSRENGSLAR
jgi:AraC-like DNA-binding protein